MVSAALGHGAAVLAAVYSQDGRRIATASADDTARIWDAVTGAPVTPPLRHDNRVQSVAFSPDGTRVVTAGWDGRARIWDARTGLAVGSSLRHEILDGNAPIRDARTGVVLNPSLQHVNIVTSAAFSPDGSRIVTASTDHSARVWDAETGRLLVGPLEHRDFVLRAVFSPDGKRILTASADRSAQIWDALTGLPVVPRFEHDDAVVRIPERLRLGPRGRVHRERAAPVTLTDGVSECIRSGDAYYIVFCILTFRSICIGLSHALAICCYIATDRAFIESDRVQDL
jgi:WD40 repeat protein